MHKKFRGKQTKVCFMERKKLERYAYQSKRKSVRLPRVSYLSLWWMKRKWHDIWLEKYSCHVYYIAVMDAVCFYLLFLLLITRQPEAWSSNVELFKHFFTTRIVAILSNCIMMFAYEWIGFVKKKKIVKETEASTDGCYAHTLLC